MADTYYGYRALSARKSYLGAEYCKVDVTTDTPQGLKSVYAVDGELTMLTSESGVRDLIREKYRRAICAKCVRRSGCIAHVPYVYGWREQGKHNQCNDFEEAE